MGQDKLRVYKGRTGPYSKVSELLVVPTVGSFYLRCTFVIHVDLTLRGPLRVYPSGLRRRGVGVWGLYVALGRFYVCRLVGLQQR